MVKKMIKGTLRRSRLILALTTGVFLLGAALSFGAGGVSGLGDSTGEKHVTGDGTPPIRNARGTAKVTDRSAEANDSSEAISASRTVEPQPQSGGGFDITSSVIAGGGGSSTGAGNLALDGTIGQAVAGTTSSNGPFSVTGGFWQQSPLSVISISGKVSYRDTTTGVKNVTLNLTGDASGSTTTPLSDGLYNFSGIPPGSYTVTPSKPTGQDVNGITGFDAARVAQHVANLITLTPNQQLAGDASQNGSLSGFDAALIAQTAASIANPGHCGEWKFNPTSRSYVSIISDQTDQNYDALLICEVSGNWIAPPAPPPVSESSTATVGESIHTNAVLPQSPAAGIPVAFPIQTGPSGPTTIGIFVGDLTGQGVISYDLTMTFDPAVLTPQNPAFDTSGTLSSGMTITPNATIPGQLTIVGFTTTPLSGSGTLLKLKFTAAASGTTPLSWTSFMFNEGTPMAMPINGQFTVGSPSAASSTITGRVLTDTGTAVSGAVVRLSGTQNRKTITDANGNYHFDTVETNGFYTVTPSRANYAFSPSQRAFSQLAERTEATFGASFTRDAVNPLDTAEYFVRQQYVDILGREPDEGGFNYWSDRVLACGSDARCVSARRRDVAAAFFIEAEFQETGSFIYGLYKGSLGRGPVYTEFSSDRQQVVAGANLDAAKQAFAESFVSRAEFASKYQANSTGESFVDALLTTVSQASGVDLGSQRAALLSRYNTGSSLNQSRSLVLRDLIDNSDFRRAGYNSAFVLTEYFSYLRRDPDQEGYAFWVDKLSNQDNYRSMVCAFVTSREYQKRFSSVVTHTDAECGEQ
jgi:hypothetical protein